MFRLTAPRLTESRERGVTPLTPFIPAASALPLASTLMHAATSPVHTDARREATSTHTNEMYAAYFEDRASIERGGQKSNIPPPFFFLQYNRLYR